MYLAVVPASRLPFELPRDADRRCCLIRFKTPPELFIRSERRTELIQLKERLQQLRMKTSALVAASERAREKRERERKIAACLRAIDCNAFHSND